MKTNKIEEIPSLGSAPAKTYTRLIAEGITHKGGLAQLAEIEQLQDPGAQLAGLGLVYVRKD